MRIGTWNLDGRWSDEHRAFLDDLDCDVLLLTEVHEDVDLDGLHRGTEFMVGNWKRWAAIQARTTLTPLPDPHPASVAAQIDGATYVCSFLPYRGVGRSHPWGPGNLGAQIEAVIATLPRDTTVWGGTWNTSLEGAEYAGSKAGRAAVLDGLAARRLVAPTAPLAHPNPEITSTDHLAVPSTWVVEAATHHPASHLSDHDAYVLEVSAPRP